jgi:hypothetical protein
MPTSLVSTGVQFPDSTTQTTALPAPGTNGNLLTSNGSAWVSSAPAGGGDYTKISTTNISSGVLSVDVTNVFTSTYRNYMIFFNGLRLTPGFIRKMELRAINSSGTVVSGYWQGGLEAYWNLNQSATQKSSMGTGNIQITPGDDASTSYSVSAVWTLIFPVSTDSTLSSQGNLLSSFFGSNYSWTNTYTGFQNNITSAALSGFRLLTESPATFAQGTIVVYGLK